MANPNTTNASGSTQSNTSTDFDATSSSKANEPFAKIGDNVERISGEVRDRASRLASDTNRAASDYFEDANAWLKQNYSKTLTVVGVLAAVGLVGWAISRSFSGGAQMRERNLNDF